MKSVSGTSDRPTKYVAFLRGINVGGHKVIRMAELKKAFESLGFKNVRTLIASGNVRFDAAKTDLTTLTHKIETKLEQVFAYKIGVMLRTIEQIEEMLRSDPFKGIPVTSDTRLYVTFLAEKPKSKLKIPYESPPEDFRILRISDREVYSINIVLQKGRGSDFMGIIEKEFGQKVTTRNWNTVLRIAASEAD